MSWIKMITKRLLGKDPFSNKLETSQENDPAVSPGPTTGTRVRALENNDVDEMPFTRTFATGAVESNAWNVGDILLDRYEIRGVKEGGMGWVYLCYDHNHKIPVALKTLKEPKNSGIAYQDLLDKFRLESETWVRLEKHKNIVQAKGVQKVNGQPFIVLEFITSDPENGADLREWISSRKRLSVQESINFGIQFCFGMEYAFDLFQSLGKPFVHRDIKPDNIMITHDGVLKITDFGLVKIFDDTKEDIFKGSGTPAYMPPEQWEADEVTDVRSDIYAFGCVLYEMLTGRPPFRCQHYSQYQYQHQNTAPVPVDSQIKNVPEELNRIVMKCLEKNPDDRFDSFKVIREKLNAVYADLTGETIRLETRSEMEAWERINKGVALSNLGYRKDAVLEYNHSMAQSPNAVNRFLPDSLASVHGWNCPENREDQLVINIMSNFSNYSNQKSIVSILEKLVPVYGLKLISVEGGFGKIDLSFYQNLPDDKKKKETADYFLKEARIQGHEYFAITTKEDIHFYGADDQELYDRNLNAFENGLSEKESWIAECERLEKALMILKKHLNNDDLNRFDDEIIRLGRFEEQAFYYIGSCLKQASLMASFPEFSKQLEILNISKQIDANQAGREKEKLLDYIRDTLDDSLKEGFEKTVYEFGNKEISEYQFFVYIKELLKKTGDADLLLKYPDLDLYIQKTVMHGELDIVKSFDEADAAVEAIRNLYYSSVEQKVLNRHLKHLDILKKAYNSKLRPSEKRYLDEHKDEMKGSRITDFIKEQSRILGLRVIEDESGSNPEDQNTVILSKRAALVGDQLTDAGGYYTAAELRSTALIKNCLRQMEEENESAGVLITGGFHSEVISRYLKDKNIPHITIRPETKLSSNDDQRYKKAVMGEKTPVERALEGEKRSRISEKKRKCWKCGTDIQESTTRVTMYDLSENHPTCEDCVPNAMAHTLTKIARQEKRDMTIQELRTFLLLDRAKGAKGLEILANRDANRIGGQMPANAGRYISFKSSDLYLKFGLNCPHCAKSWEIAFTKEVWGNTNPTGNSEATDPLIQALFFKGMKETIEVKCPHCNGSFVAMK